MFMVPSDFARKLERERDEAREQNSKLCDIAERAVWRMVAGACLSDAGAIAAIREEGLRLRAELNQLKEAK
jgi:porphobilinogen deaminase